MATDRRLGDSISRWLEETAPPRVPERVLEATFERTRRSSQQVGLRALLGRNQLMNKVLVAAGSVAAVALVGVIGIGIVGGGGSGPGANTSPSATPTTTPNPTPAPTPSVSKVTEGPLEAGQYFTDVDGIRYTFTVPESGWSWSTEAGGVHQGDDSELAVFWPGGDIDVPLYRRACESSGTEFDPGPSVDDVANALVSLEDFDVTAPTDVTVSGYAGKRVALSVPMDVDVGSPDCDEGRYSLAPGRWFQAPGQTDAMSILEVDGVRQVVVVSNTPATSADVTAQLGAMLDSLEIEPR